MLAERERAISPYHFHVVISRVIFSFAKKQMPERKADTATFTVR